MPLQGKKLGLLLSACPEHANFERGIKLAESAMNAGVQVYLYCIDESVAGLAHPRLQELQERGLKLYACAYGAQRRNLALTDQATFGGLTILSDLIAATDRFISFN